MHLYLRIVFATLTLTFILCTPTAFVYAEAYDCGDGFYRAGSKVPASCQPLRSSTTCSNGNRYITPGRANLSASTAECESTGEAVSPFTHLNLRPTKQSAAPSFQFLDFDMNGFQERIEGLLENYQGSFDSLLSHGFQSSDDCS